MDAKALVVSPLSDLDVAILPDRGSEALSLVLEEGADIFAAICEAQESEAVLDLVPKLAFEDLAALPEDSAPVVFAIILPPPLVDVL